VRYTRFVDIDVEIHPDLVWDYPAAPRDPMWRLQRIADAFPAYGRDRRTVELLHRFRDALRLAPEIRTLIELYKEAWDRRDAGGAGG
jgi:hypothetical protein